MRNTIKRESYDSSSEKELIKMWEDIKGGNLNHLNRNLMKDIAKAEEEKEIEGPEQYSKQMWDSEIGKWVEFNLWGAHFIVNSRKETVCMRMYRPMTIQSEFGPTLWGWQTMDGSHLTEKLKEKENPYVNYEINMESFAGRQASKEMIKQNIQEYRNEQRYEEMRLTHSVEY